MTSLKLENPMARKSDPNGLRSGVNMKMASNTRAGPVTAPGMKKIVRSVEEKRPGRMCKSRAMTTTMAMPSGTETTRNLAMLLTVAPNRKSVNVTP